MGLLGRGWAGHRGEHLGLVRWHLDLCSGGQARGSQGRDHLGMGRDSQPLPQGRGETWRESCGWGWHPRLWPWPPGV